MANGAEEELLKKEDFEKLVPDEQQAYYENLGSQHHTFRAYQNILETYGHPQ